MIMCEMIVIDFFKLSVGQIALVGKIVPDIDKFILNANADLFIGGEKVKTINIIGEDRFSGGNVEKRQGMRSIRTNDDIAKELSESNDKEVKLIIYINMPI